MKFRSKGGIALIAVIVALSVNLLYHPPLVTDPRPDGKIQLIVESKVADADMYQAFYILEDATTYSEDRSTQINVAASEEWQNVTFDLPYKGLERVRVDFGTHENKTTLVKKIYFAGEHFVQLPVLEFFHFASGLQINNKCEYVELVSINSDPIWSSEDISQQIQAFVNKERSTSLGLSVARIAGSNLLIFTGLYALGFVFIRERKK